MVSKDSLQKVKKEVETYMGQEILVTANLGRNKSICRKGIIDSTYSDLFLFKENETENKISFNYTDLVTNNLQISSIDGSVFTHYDFAPAKYTRL